MTSIREHAGKYFAAIVVLILVLRFGEDLPVPEATPEQYSFGVLALAALGYAVYKEFVSSRLKGAAEMALQEMIQTLSDDYSRVQEERDDARKAQGELMQQMLELRQQFTKLSEQNMSLQLQYTELKIEREELLHQISALRRDVEELTSKNEALLQTLYQIPGVNRRGP